MSQLIDRIRDKFNNEETRYVYADGFANALIASQIKFNREAREMSQGKLAEIAGTRQSGISRLENVNYSSWKVETLRKIARAFGLRLKLSFEEFGTLLPEIENHSEDLLVRRGFEQDPVFKSVPGAAARNRTLPQRQAPIVPPTDKPKRQERKKPSRHALTGVSRPAIKGDIGTTPSSSAKRQRSGPSGPRKN